MSVRRIQARCLWPWRANIGVNIYWSHWVLEVAFMLFSVDYRLLKGKAWVCSPVPHSWAKEMFVEFWNMEQSRSLRESWGCHLCRMANYEGNKPREAGSPKPSAGDSLPLMGVCLEVLAGEPTVCTPDQTMVLLQWGTLFSSAMCAASEGTHVECLGRKGTPIQLPPIWSQPDQPKWP